MRIEVEMLAFGNGKIRTVTIPDDTAEEHVLNQTYFYGQNDFCEEADLAQQLPSVSVGDVIWLPTGIRFLVQNVGFRPLS